MSGSWCRKSLDGICRVARWCRSKRICARMCALAVGSRQGVRWVEGSWGDDEFGSDSIWHARNVAYPSRRCEVKGCEAR
jgi:hypothetical protein